MHLARKARPLPPPAGAIAALAAGLLLLLAASAIPAAAPDSGRPPPSAGPRDAALPPPSPDAPMPERVPTYGELASEVRADMPDLDLTMIRYHAEPEARFVILNGIRGAEGLPVGRELWIHEIRPREVVMKYIDRYFLLRPR